MIYVDVFLVAALFVIIVAIVMNFGQVVALVALLLALGILVYAAGLLWSRGYHRGKREFVVGMMNDCTNKEGTRGNGKN